MPASFDRRDIRPGMDVYTRDGVYLGTVLTIEATPETHSAVRPGRAALAEEGSFSGESLGPASTAGWGNRGPATQSAAAGYAATPDGAPLLISGRIEVGKLPGPLSARWVALTDVQSVAMERIVLGLAHDQVVGSASSGPVPTRRWTSVG